MRKCKSGCGGKMKLMKAGGSTSLAGKITIPLKDNNPLTTRELKKGGPIKLKAKAGAVVNVGVKANPPVGKRHNLTHTGYESVSKPQMAKGGATKNAKLAAMAAPTNKITRADIITAAKKNARKKKK